MTKAKSVRVDESIHTRAKADAALRQMSLQEMANKALSNWFPALDAMRNAVVTGETEKLAELLQEIDDA